MSDLTQEDALIFIQNLFKDVINSLDDGPFHLLNKALSSIKLSLLTSSGHFLKEYDPKPLGVENMTQEEAERRVFDFLREAPQLSEIPFNSNPEDLMARHGGYDIRAAIKDPNVSFPYQRMMNLKDQGEFAELTLNAYSFVGACSQKRLLKKTLPGWVDKFISQGVNAVVLVPV